MDRGSRGGAGNYSQTVRIAAILGLVLVLAFATGRAATNEWIKGSSGAWEETNSWSLGILPDASQSVLITNAGVKTIEINGATGNTFSASLTVSNLMVGTTNTLLLSDLDTNTPLRVLNLLRIDEGARLLNFDSGIEVGGLMRMDCWKGDVQQNGGICTNGTLLIISGTYSVSNGIFKSGGITSIFGDFSQSGGDVTVTGGISFAYGGYSLYDGNLNSSNIDLTGQEGGASFYQHGGTNRTGSIAAGGVGVVTYTMDEGSLFSSDVSLFAGRNEVFFIQNGGIHVITNLLKLTGAAYHYPWEPIPAAYHASKATFSAGSIAFYTSYGQCLVSLDDCNSTVAGNIEFHGPSINLSQFSFSGTLSCSNVIYAGGAGVDLNQGSGAAFNVTDLLSVDGHYPGGFNGVGARPSRYTLSDGTLFASNIQMFAEWHIESSTQTNRITNPGYFKLGGSVFVGDAVEQLGRFILASNAVIDLGDGNAKLGFAKSSAEQWASGTALTITNWTGMPNGGGNDILKFGGDGSGLAPSQLARIRFINPAGFPAGNYMARILETGEVVPAQRPQIGYSQQGNALILTWPTDFILQAATNVTGPFVDITNAVSPFTNLSVDFPKRFFRLKQ